MPEVCAKINFLATYCRNGQLDMIKGMYLFVDNKIAVGKYLQTNMVIINQKYFTWG